MKCAMDVADALMAPAGAKGSSTSNGLGASAPCSHAYPSDICGARAGGSGCRRVASRM